LAVESRSRVESLLRVIGALDFEIDTYGGVSHFLMPWSWCGPTWPWPT